MPSEIPTASRKNYGPLPGNNRIGHVGTKWEATAVVCFALAFAAVIVVRILQHG